MIDRHHERELTFICDSLADIGMLSSRHQRVFVCFVGLLACVNADIQCQLFEVDTQFSGTSTVGSVRLHCLPDPACSGNFFTLAATSVPAEISATLKMGGSWITVVTALDILPFGGLPIEAEIRLSDPPSGLVTTGTCVGGILDGIVGSIRRTIRTSGESNILVVRVVASDSTPNPTTTQLSNAVFGNGVDSVTLISQYAACSKNQLMFTKATGETGDAITDGVVQITLSQDVVGKDRYEVGAAAETAAAEQLGSLWRFDHIMFCLPPNTEDGDRWVAFAYLGFRTSVYNDRWCTYLSPGMHEIGHNLRLRHSGDSGLEYGDQSGMMGFSYEEDNTPIMCFNPAKNYELGWFSDCVTEATNLALRTGRTLVGPAEYAQGSCAADEAVVIRVSTGDEQDLYIGYNKQVGSNSGTREHGDEVTVLLANPQEASTLQAALSPGQEHVHAGADGTIVVKFCSVEGGKAKVGVVLQGQDPCSICNSDAQCDNGAYCDGVETCRDGTCMSGTSISCDDGVFCNGEEQCDEDSDSCSAGTAPCRAELCDEAASVCYECLADADCSDGAYCNGVETCIGRACVAGTAVQCSNGVFCDGMETCDDASRFCVNGTVPCEGDRCNEADSTCSCTETAQCDNGLYCDGQEVCEGGVCNNGLDACAQGQCIEADEKCDEEEGGDLKEDESSGASAPLCGFVLTFLIAIASLMRMQLD